MAASGAPDVDGGAGPSRRTPEPGPDLGAARGVKILVIEDSRSARRLLHELLIRLGVAPADLRLAATIPEAMQEFADWTPEVAIVDLQLRPPTNGARADPDAPAESPTPRNGAELAMRFLERKPELKVIICSASEPEGTVLDPLLHAGRVRSLVKPLLAARVADTLRQVLEPPDDAPPAS